MKCFSVSITLHPEGAATVSYESPAGRVHHTVVDADRVVLFSACLIGLARDGVLFDEDGSMSPEAMRDLRTVAAMCHGGE
nr:MAG TPA: hypothetical protein [Caudoviricetes sp.]